MLAYLLTKVNVTAQDSGREGSSLQTAYIAPHAFSISYTEVPWSENHAMLLHTGAEHESVALGKRLVDRALVGF